MEEIDLLLCALLLPAAAAFQAPPGLDSRVRWFVYTMFTCLAAHICGALLVGPIGSSAALLAAGLLSILLAARGARGGVY